MSSLLLLAPEGVAAPTGGNIYDRQIVAALTRLRVEAALREVPGPWPDDSPAAADRLRAAAGDGAAAVLVDGLVACGCPQAVAALGASVLAHLPVALEAGLPVARREALAAVEARTLRAARSVVCPSAWTARYLGDHYGVPTDRLAVAHPGTAEVTPPAPGRRPGPPRLTSLASLTPRKNALALVEALAASVDLPWTLTICGPDDADPGYAARLRARATLTDVRGRVTVTGSREGQDLEDLWGSTDLLVLPSLAETFGMVVTEAIARGIPAVVVAGTGAQEALGLAGEPPAGSAVELPDLPAVLRRWLMDPQLRAAWAGAARDGAGRLPTWDDAARELAAALGVTTHG